MVQRDARRLRAGDRLDVGGVDDQEPRTGEGDGGGDGNEGADGDGHGESHSDSLRTCSMYCLLVRIDAAADPPGSGTASSSRITQPR